MTNENNNESLFSQLKITKNKTIEEIVEKILNDIDNDNSIIDEWLSNVPRNDAAVFLASSDGVSRLLKVKNENHSNLMKLIDMYARINKNSINNSATDSLDDAVDDYLNEKVRQKILNG